MYLYSLIKYTLTLPAGFCSLSSHNFEKPFAQPESNKTYTNNGSQEGKSAFMIPANRIYVLNIARANLLCANFINFIDRPEKNTAP